MWEAPPGDHPVTLLGIVGVMALGALGGLVGALLGLGCGVFLVPALTLVYGLPFRHAAGIGLMTVIATSSVVSAQKLGDGTVNFRLGIVLEIATTVGGLAGGLTAQALPQRTLRLMFGAVALFIAAVMFRGAAICGRSVVGRMIGPATRCGKNETKVAKSIRLRVGLRSRR